MTKTVCLLVSIAALGCGDNTPDVLPDATIPTPDASAVDAPPPQPGITYFDYAIAVDITPDGRTAVFEDLSTGVVRAIVVDTVTGAIAEPIDVGDPLRNVVTAIAGTGRLTAIQGEPVVAAYRDAGGWLDLASPYASGCDGNEGGAWDVSADATVVVGFLWNGCSPAAFRWLDGDATPTILQILGATTENTHPPTNRATVVSDDGKVAAGFAENLMLDRSPAIWTADGTGFLIDPADQNAPGEVLSISADGARVAGIWANEGFVWSSATGRTAIPLLDTFLPGDPVFPNAMTGDGSLVFGGMGSSFFGIPAAFVWSDAAGSRDLTTLARAAGIAIPADTILGNVLGASVDGTVLIGTATTDVTGAGVQKTFVLRLPASAL